MQGFLWPCMYMCRGTSPIRKRQPPKDLLRTLGIGLRKGPRGVRFLRVRYPCTEFPGGGAVPHEPSTRAPLLNELKRYPGACRGSSLIRKRLLLGLYNGSFPRSL